MEDAEFIRLVSALMPIVKQAGFVLWCDAGKLAVSLPISPDVRVRLPIESAQAIVQAGTMTQAGDAQPSFPAVPVVQRKPVHVARLVRRGRRAG